MSFKLTLQGLEFGPELYFAFEKVETPYGI